MKIDYDRAEGNDYLNDALNSSEGNNRTALVLAGGIALGAFEGGAYAALDKVGLSASLGWVTGSSIGAVAAAIIAGNAPQDRVARLRQFWETASSDPMSFASFWFGPPPDGLWRQAYNQVSVLQTLLFGRPGLFRPRLHPGPRAGASDVSALFDLAPLRAHLTSLIDFDRLNSGEMRITVVATDVLSGQRVVFDTAHGTVIGPEHVLASCAMLPMFAPVEIAGRLLGDGGLSSNAPLDIVLSDPAASGLLCFVIDLFGSEGSRPHTLAASASRAADLTFGNQSSRLLEGQAREGHLRALIDRLGSLLPPDLCREPEIAAILSEGRFEPTKIVYVSYRAGLDEAGLGKPFDFSSATIADRWRAGKLQMQAALQALAIPAKGALDPEAGALRLAFEVVLADAMTQKAST
ncbi:MAG: patatin-like phospholipase family protein [Janthinobacterium lividum]